MKTAPLSPEDLAGVIAVPPLARRADARRSLEREQNDRLLRHMHGGGLRRFLYGGNAFLYHATLAEFEEMLDWLSAFPDDAWAIPSLGPSFGRAMDQAVLLRRKRFPVAMALPCADPRDAAGLEKGLREVAQAAGLGLIVYLKDEGNFGADREAGLEAVARLVDDGVCVGIKYAVVRPDPEDDPYLRSLLEKVDRRRVVSGMGERPAVAHLRALSLPGFTTGSGCLAPALSQSLFEACARRDWTAAEECRRLFLPLEDQRDEWGPARVLHAALELAEVAVTGPIPPFVSALSADQRGLLEPTARALLAREREKAGQAAGGARR